MLDGAVLWTPSPEQQAGSNLIRYMRWLELNRGLAFDDYHSLWQWSVDHLEDFWCSIWDYFRIRSHTSYTTAISDYSMPGVEWFKSARVNYAEHIFRHAENDKTAIIFQAEHLPLTRITWGELRRSVAAVAEALKMFGVQSGDRVVSYMPNIPQTVIAFLACASIGAVWSSCSPDFGTPSVVDRFRQIEPKVLFAVDGYQYNGITYSRLPALAELQRELPTLRKTVLVPYLDDSILTADSTNTVLWDDIIKTDAELTFEHVDFSHPLWVLYSSGTTGLPKAIVQGHGGILLEHLKIHELHNNIGPDDKFFWYTTTGWMMWNFLVGTLLVGSTILIYDGNPGYPNLDVLWDFAEKSGATYFGTGASYLLGCMKRGLEPGRVHDLAKLKAIGATGSPLSAEGFEWVYDRVKNDVWLAPTSGGTDLCTAFVGPCPVLPVQAGKMQCRMLGAKIEAWDESGQSVTGEIGELVISKPMPSMPLYFWNDQENRRYRESYFDMYPGVWRHGDWIKIDEDDSCIIYGRSDSTINRQGIRMGTSEIYRVVEAFDDVVDSLVVDLELLGRKSFLPLFVVLKAGSQLDEELKQKICDQIRANVTPRHVPDEIFVVDEIPRTLNGKKLEVPVRRILLGHPLEKAVNPDSMSNPESLSFFIELAKKL